MVSASALVGILPVRRSQTSASGVGSPLPAGPLNVGSFVCSSGMLYPRKRMPWWEGQARGRGVSAGRGLTLVAAGVGWLWVSGASGRREGVTTILHPRGSGRRGARRPSAIGLSDR
jgi:hypothetical protein